MSDGSSGPDFAMQLTGKWLVATLPSDLEEETLNRFRRKILAKIHSRGLQKVAIDISGVRVVDSHNFENIKKTMEMISLLGATAKLVGLSPGLITSLIALNVDTDMMDVGQDISSIIKLRG